MASYPTHPKLSAIQLHLSRFFSERSVSDSETVEIQRIIANYYAHKADQRIDEIWELRGYTENTMDEIIDAPLIHSPK